MLKKQAEKLEGKWYWENYKDRIEIKDNQVIFDKTVVFTLKRNFDEDQIVEEDFTVTFEGETFEFKKGEVIEGLGEYYTLYCDGEDITDWGDFPLEDNGSNALQQIMLYIAHCI
jgi:hypothetical protein